MTATAAPEATKPATFVLRVTQKVERTTEVDLESYIASLDDQQRTEYADFDLTTWGFTHEWERPFAYTYATIHENCGLDSNGVGGGLHSHLVSDSTSDASDWPEPRVSRRSGTFAGGDESRWSEKDFWSLATTTPWIVAVFHASNPDGLNAQTRAEFEKTLALRPGPNDVPLFD